MVGPLYLGVTVEIVNRNDLHTFASLEKCQCLWSREGKLTAILQFVNLLCLALLLSRLCPNLN